MGLFLVAHAKIFDLFGRYFSRYVPNKVQLFLLPQEDALIFNIRPEKRVIIFANDARTCVRVDNNF
jgi:hypothetical protein